MPGNAVRRLIVTGSFGIVIGLTACAGSGPQPATASGNSGTGPVTVTGRASGPPSRSTHGSYTAAFARCMRAHGVPKFPDPGKYDDGTFGPGGPVDPGSAAYLAAINGPCRPLAPAAWVSSGQVSG